MTFLSDLQSVHNRVVTLEAQMALLNSTAVTHKPTAVPIDRTLLVIGKSGSSLALSLDDIASIWLSHLNIVPPVRLKLEASAVEVPDGDPPLSAIFPPISLFLSNSSGLNPPSVTTQLVARLPKSAVMQRQLLDSVNDVLALHPSFNFQHFQTRVHGMFSWSSEADNSECATGDSTVPSTPTYATRDSTPTRPTLSFFAAASAGFALGSLVQNRLAPLEDDYPICSDPYPFADRDPTTSPTALFVLSEQTLAIFERSHHYDLDYMVAMILQVIYLLHEGKPRLPHTILPLVSPLETSDIKDDSHTYQVGKMVNTARMMGLNLDPDDFPGTYTLFEAEARRRLWWDVLYYDLYVPGAITVILGVLTRERKVCVRFHGPSTVNSG